MRESFLEAIESTCEAPLNSSGKEWAISFIAALFFLAFLSIIDKKIYYRLTPKGKEKAAISIIKIQWFILIVIIPLAALITYIVLGGTKVIALMVIMLIIGIIEFLLICGFIEHLLFP